MRKKYETDLTDMQLRKGMRTYKWEKCELVNAGKNRLPIAKFISRFSTSFYRRARLSGQILQHLVN